MQSTKDNAVAVNSAKRDPFTAKNVSLLQSTDQNWVGQFVVHCKMLYSLACNNDYSMT